MIAIRWYRILLGICITLIFAGTLFKIETIHERVSGHIVESDHEAFRLFAPQEQQEHKPEVLQEVFQNNSKSILASPYAAAALKNGLTREEENMNAEQILADRASSAHAANGRPVLDTIIDDQNNIIGDPSWLLNFGIIGYGKCGTSTMMIWLKEHPEVEAFGYELRDLLIRRPGALVRRLYTRLKAGEYQRGYKAPQDISQDHILDYYRKYWPKAKLIVGIRHPVRWMESLYNFRVQNLDISKTMPHPNKLIGQCMKGQFHTCTAKGDFAFTMLKLGKHNYPHPRPPRDIETKIARRYPRAKVNTTLIPHMDNPLFLFDLEQLNDADDFRKNQFRLDMTKFMGLNETLPPLPHYKPGRRQSFKDQRRRDAMKIDICDDEYAPLRSRLMEHAVDASIFIRTIWLNNPTVVISSRDHFHSIMQSWMVDPCTIANTNHTIVGGNQTFVK